MDVCLSKSDAGRQEIKSRAHALSRHARNLLLIVDSSRPASEWLAMVCGTQEDLRQLIDLGLLVTVGAPPARAARRVEITAEAPLAEVLAHLEYGVLYNWLTAQAKERLGLIRGYRLVLEIEKASGPQEMRALAVHFVDLVREAHGEQAGRDTQQALADLARK